MGRAEREFLRREYLERRKALREDIRFYLRHGLIEGACALSWVGGALSYVGGLVATALGQQELGEKLISWGLGGVIVGVTGIAAHRAYAYAADEPERFFLLQLFGSIKNYRRLKREIKGKRK